MIVKKINPINALNAIKSSNRPNVKDYVSRIFTDFIELKGDRYFADDKAIYGGIGYVNGKPVTVVGTVKGKKTIENVESNFGMPQPEGYRKALRLFKQAEKFNRPIICIIDTPGAYCGLGAEERGQGRAIADNLVQMMLLKVPVLAIITGEGGSGGALALAVANRVIMQENAMYSVISPKGCASILWKDSTLEKEAAKELKITSDKLYEFGIIDDIISEPMGGAHMNANKASSLIKEKIIEFLDLYKDKTSEEILNERYSKFRQMGVFEEAENAEISVKSELGLTE